MIGALRQFFGDLAGKNDRRGIGEEQIRLAVAGLLAHVVAVDGAVADNERAVLVDVLKVHFDLDADEAVALAAAGTSADAEAVDLYGFTSVLKQRLSDEDRRRIIEMMWRLVYADGKVHEFEDNAVWRVAELLAVPAQVRIGLKQAARHDAE
jgi:uncharacterized tellurite resistance protein B-like protein